jgi:Flp pilus assembly protein CpaB
MSGFSGSARGARGAGQTVVDRGLESPAPPVGPATNGPATNGHGAVTERRVIGPRRARVNGRALLGGFLVAASCVGLFAGYTEARADHRLAYVVAARQITPGTTITASDLTTERMLLPSALAENDAFRTPGILVGAEAVAPLRAGELVQASDVVAGSAGLYPQEISFSLDPSRALDGSLAPGETVAVLATYGSGQQAVSQVVVPFARILSVDPGAESLGTRGAETITLGLFRPGDALALTNAVDAGQLELVRSRTPDTGLGNYPSAATGPGPPP